MRWMIGLLAGLALACVAGGYILFVVDPATVPTRIASDSLRVQIDALGLVFVAIVLERTAVVLSFLHSWRANRWVWCLTLVSLCLVISLNSLFFTLRIKGVLPVSWTLLQLPPEEVTPPLEALLLAPSALAYAIWYGSGRSAKTVEKTVGARGQLGQRDMPPQASLGEALTEPLAEPLGHVAVIAI